MPIGAAIAGAAGIGGALIGSSAAKSAAQTQATAATQASQQQLEAARLAASLQLGMFNTIRGDLSPYRTFGATALPGLSALLGLPTGAPATTTQQATTVLPAGAYAGGTNFGGLTGGVSYGPNGELIVPGVSGAGGPSFGGLAGGPVGPPVKVGDTNYQQLFKDRPDVMAEYQRLSAGADRNSPWFSQHGLDSPENFANWWLSNKPANDTYQAPTWTQAQIDSAYPQTPATGTSGTPATPTGPTLLGAGGGSGDIQAFLESLPGYQFAKQQGLKAVTNSAAARGVGGMSGAYGKGIARFVTGLADQTYGEQLDRMFRVAGIGQSAANQTGAYGSTAASGAGGNLVGGANAVAQGIIGAGNAGAAGQIGSANAISGGLQSAGNTFLTSQILGMYNNPSSMGYGTQGYGIPADMQGLI